MRDEEWKPTFKEIDEMGLGDLIHFMIGEYDKGATKMYGNGPYVQSPEYHHAYTRLNDAVEINKETN